jgi:TctA family transporter
MSDGRYSIFVQRPVSVVFLASAIAMILLAVKPLIRKKAGFRDRLTEAERSG